MRLHQWNTVHVRAMIFLLKFPKTIGCSFFNIDQTFCLFGLSLCGTDYLILIYLFVNSFQICFKVEGFAETKRYLFCEIKSKIIIAIPLSNLASHATSSKDDCHREYWTLHGTGFPPIRENSEIFENFFQSGKNGVFSQNQGEIFQSMEIFQQ